MDGEAWFQCKLCRALFANNDAVYNHLRDTHRLCNRTMGEMSEFWNSVKFVEPSDGVAIPQVVGHKSIKMETINEISAANPAEMPTPILIPHISEDGSQKVTYHPTTFMLAQNGVQRLPVNSQLPFFGGPLKLVPVPMLQPQIQLQQNYIISDSSSQNVPWQVESVQVPMNSHEELITGDIHPPDEDEHELDFPLTKPIKIDRRATKDPLRNDASILRLKRKADQANLAQAIDPPKRLRAPKQTNSKAEKRVRAKMVKAVEVVNTITEIRRSSEESEEIEIVKEGSAYACQMAHCGKKLGTFNGLKSHLLAKHGTRFDGRDPTLDPFYCQLCEAEFRDFKFFSEMRAHTNWRHKNAHAVQCPICALPFKTMNYLHFHTIQSHCPKYWKDLGLGEKDAVERSICYSRTNRIIACPHPNCKNEDPFPNAAELVAHVQSSAHENEEEAEPELKIEAEEEEVEIVEIKYKYECELN